MRRLLNMTDWRWSDQRPDDTRWSYFWRSGESLALITLLSYAFVLLTRGDTFATSAAFTWIRAHFTEGQLSAFAVALACLSPLALWLNAGVLRLLALVSQSGYFLMFGISFHATSPQGLGWASFTTGGVWLLVRAGFLLRHHWRRGGGGCGER